MRFVPSEIAAALSIGQLQGPLKPGQQAAFALWVLSRPPMDVYQMKAALDTAINQLQDAMAAVVITALVKRDRELVESPSLWSWVIENRDLLVDASFMIANSE